MRPAAQNPPAGPAGPDGQGSEVAEHWPAGQRWRAVQRWLTATVASGVTSPPAPRPAWLRRGRADFVFLADVLIGLICFASTNSALSAQNHQHGKHYGAGLLVLAAFAVSAPLVLRTRLPLTAWTASVVATLWVSVVIPSRFLATAAYLPAGVIVYLLCLYAVAVRCKPWVVVSAAVVTLFGAVLVDVRSAAGALLAAIPLLMGVIVRVRRSGEAALAEQEQRHVGERTLLEERQRIARELHDIVAHHMSVIAIQAEAGPYKSADPPAELVQSFTEIRASALTGLAELRRLLGVLRSEEPGTAPQPGLRDLDGLLESARAGGVTVTATTSGTSRPLPEGADLSAYRIVQEALSNAMRHAPGTAVQIQLGYRDSGLLIEVRNDASSPAAGPLPDPDGHAPAEPGPDGHGPAGPGPGGPAPAEPGPGGPAPAEPGPGGHGPAGPGRGGRAPAEPGRAGPGPGGPAPAGPGPGAGHGIIGMRERTAMLGGHLSAGPTPNGGFLVTAFLPLEQGPAEVAS